MENSKSTLIQGGTIVRGKDVVAGDLLIRGEHIEAIGDLGDKKADETIDASGLLVLPGAVDTHVHFNDFFMNTKSVHDYATGTRAAAFGGVTSLIDFSNQVQGKPLLETLEAKKKEAEGKALVDWGVHPVITDPSPSILDEIAFLVDQGTPTFKCYMTYRSQGLMVQDGELKRILECLREAGGMLMVHAEDNDIIEKNVSRFLRLGRTKPVYHARSRPPEVENRAIRRCIQLVEETQGRLFIVHMATAEGIQAVAEARSSGLEVFAETCTHYLIFSESMLEREDGTKWICSPPLRKKSVQEELWQGVKDGRISMVSSDDAAFSWEAKLFGRSRFDKCPNGIPGIEVRLSLLYSEGVAKGRLTLPRFVELVSSAPAALFGLAPQKGSLCPGADADIVLFDPKERWTMNAKSLHMATDWSAYDGIEVTGKIRKVFSRGELIIDGNLCLGKRGRGGFLKRKLDRSSPL